MSPFQASEATQEQNPSSHPTVKASVRQSENSSTGGEISPIDHAYHQLMIALDDPAKRYWCDQLKAELAKRKAQT